MTFVSIYHNSVTVCNLQDCTPLVPTKSTYPFEIISFDYIHLDKCKGGLEYVLIV